MILDQNTKPNPVWCVLWINQGRSHGGRTAVEGIWIVKCLCQKLLSQLMKENLFFLKGMCASEKVEQDD